MPLEQTATSRTAIQNSQGRRQSHYRETLAIFWAIVSETIHIGPKFAAAAGCLSPAAICFTIPSLSPPCHRINYLPPFSKILTCSPPQYPIALSLLITNRVCIQTVLSHPNTASPHPSNLSVKSKTNIRLATLAMNINCSSVLVK